MVLSSEKDSACIVWSSMFSDSTGLNVPGPTCNVRYSMAMPRFKSAVSKFSVKCNPAVGEAMDPGFLAYIVWYSRAISDSSMVG